VSPSAAAEGTGALLRRKRSRDARREGLSSVVARRWSAARETNMRRDVRRLVPSLPAHAASPFRKRASWRASGSTRHLAAPRSSGSTRSPMIEPGSTWRCSKTFLLLGHSRKRPAGPGVSSTGLVSVRSPVLLAPTLVLSLAERGGSELHSAAQRTSATPQIDSQSSSCASSNRVPVALAQATKTGLPLASKN
jgi:hypothetical protein